MAAYRVQAAAGRRIDDIYTYTRATWRAVPRDIGVDGFYCRYERHFIYWLLLSDDVVGIVTVLHKRMHQIDRFRDDMPN